MSSVELLLVASGYSYRRQDVIVYLTHIAFGNLIADTCVTSKRHDTRILKYRRECWPVWWNQCTDNRAAFVEMISSGRRMASLMISSDGSRGARLNARGPKCATYITFVEVSSDFSTFSAVTTNLQCPCLVFSLSNTTNHVYSSNERQVQVPNSVW